MSPVAQHTLASFNRAAAIFGLARRSAADQQNSGAEFQPAAVLSRRIAIGGVFLLALALLIYSPLLPGGLIMDDARLIQTDNPIVNGTLGPGSIWFHADFPLSTFVLWLQFNLWGANPLGYHAVNVFLHALSAFLLWRVLSALGARGAWLAAMLFAVHPVCVASVGRIAEIKNTLSLPFCLLSLWAYLRYERIALYPAEKGNGTQYYAISLVAFVLALMSKTTVAMLPFVLLCSAAWQRRRVRIRDLVHTSPHFLLAFGFGLMSSWFQKHQALGGEHLPSESFLDRLLLAARMFWFYLGKAIFPLNLSLAYPQWKMNAAALISWVPILLLLLSLLLCWAFRRTWGRHVLFALGCFLITLFPALGFFDAQFLKLWQVSDHLEYWPLAAPVALAAAMLASLPRVMAELVAQVSNLLYRSASSLRTFLKSDYRTAGEALPIGNRRSSRFETCATPEWQKFLCMPADLPGRMGLMVVCGGIVALLSVSSFKRAHLFTNEEALLRDAVTKNPKAWAAHNDLGCFLAQRNCIPEAIDHFATSLKYKPEHIEAHVNLGHALLRMGRVNDAETNFMAALHFKPGCADAHCGYAKVLAMRNKRVEAICHLHSALISRPDAQTSLQLAEMLYQSSDRRGAIRQLRGVAEREEEIPEAFNNLAWLLATSPDPELRNGKQAIHYARRACRLTHFKEAQMVATLAAAYAEAGRFDDAVRTVEKAIQLATAAGQTQFAGINQQLLKLYREGRPYHEPLRLP